MVDLYVLTLNIILKNPQADAETLAYLISKAIREELYNEFIKLEVTK